VIITPPSYALKPESDLCIGYRSEVNSQGNWHIRKTFKKTRIRPRLPDQTRHQQARKSTHKTALDACGACSHITEAVGDGVATATG
jgi:hypothetical protein